MTRIYVAIDRWLEALTRERDGWTRQRTSPGEDLQSVAVTPDRPQRVFCASLADGLLRSVDAGKSFERIGTNTIESTDVTSVAIDPSDTSIVYAGTEPSRLYRSLDGGDTWSEIEGLQSLSSAEEWSFPPRPDTHHVRTIAVDPNDSERLYVGIEAGATLVSEDAGTSWIERPTGARRDPHWLTTHPAAAGRVYLAAGDGYAQSETGGRAWHRPQSGLDHRYVWSVAADPGAPERVLVSAAESASSTHQHETAATYVYRRRGEEPWERLTDTGLPMGGGVMRTVLAGGTAPGELFAGSNHGIYHTSDAGETWVSIDPQWDDRYQRSAPRGIAVIET